MSDELSHWWPDWYQYSRDYISNNIIFGDRILFRPKITIDSTTYIQWGGELHLSLNGTLLVGPFDFESISLGNITRLRVAGKHWRALHNVCCNSSLLPPTTGATEFNVVSVVLSIQS